MNIRIRIVCVPIQYVNTLSSIPIHISIRTNLNKEIKYHNSSFLAQRRQFSRETESIEQVLQDIEYHVSNSGKAEVITKQQDLLTAIQTIYRKPMTSFVTTPVPCDFPRYNFNRINKFNILTYLFVSI